MGTRIKRLLLAATAAAAVAAPAVAEAHNPSSAFGPTSARWAGNPSVLQYYFDQTVPKGRWRTRIKAAADEWNRYGRSVQLTTPDPQTNSTRADPSFSCPTQLKSRSIVFRAAFGGTQWARALGLNFQCRSTWGEPLYFRQYYNADSPLWTDPNGNEKVSPNAFDLQSVAAHEMGHATGWGAHLDDDGPDAGDAKDYKGYCRSWNQQGAADDVYAAGPTDTYYTAKQTMCYALPPGTSNQRRLGIHDRGTFRNAYPARP